MLQLLQSEASFRQLPRQSFHLTEVRLQFRKFRFAHVQLQQDVLVFVLGRLPLGLQGSVRGGELLQGGGQLRSCALKLLAQRAALLAVFGEFAAERFELADAQLQQGNRGVLVFERRGLLGFRLGVCLAEACLRLFEFAESSPQPDDLGLFFSPEPAVRGGLIAQLRFCWRKVARSRSRSASVAVWIWAAVSR
jgi:hypothetical protein